jgi:ribonucleoside-diphosphate reductase alpha chain
MDYIFRWMQSRFLTGQQQLLFESFRPRITNGAADVPSAQPDGVSTQTTLPLARRPEAGTREPGAGSIHAADALSSIVDLGDAPTCSFCGSIMTRNGSCYRCMSCGSTSGCS